MTTCRAAVVLEFRTKIKQDDVITETDRRWELQTKLKGKAKVFLHSPDDVTAYEMLPLFDLLESENVESLISMKQTYTTDDARQLTVKQRKCIFQDELNLKYYKDDIYSLSACMIKCRMQKAMKLCGCIPPFYAPANENLQWRSCKSTLENIACLARYRKNITSISGCSHCELSCFTTIYETEKFTLRYGPAIYGGISRKSR
jgi:acid-sensing ion channel, other